RPSRLTRLPTPADGTTRRRLLPRARLRSHFRVRRGGAADDRRFRGRLRAPVARLGERVGRVGTRLAMAILGGLCGLVPGFLVLLTLAALAWYLLGARPRGRPAGLRPLRG